VFRVFTTAEFDRDFRKLDSQEQKVVTKILRQIKEQGNVVGKPLAGLTFFREKKFGGKRLYYLIYEGQLLILALAISTKKTHQATVNAILSDLERYKRHITEEIGKKES
jgi:mRNA-degrading endonuclease RelE of RelBE toxin-antitoxin system